MIWELDHDCSNAGCFSLSYASGLRQAKAKALPLAFADHNAADYSIFCSLGTIGSMAGPCANIVASWFADKNTPSFLALQIGFAMLVLAAIVSLFAFLPILVGNWRSRPNRTS